MSKYLGFFDFELQRKNIKQFSRKMFFLFLYFIFLFFFTFLINLINFEIPTRPNFLPEITPNVENQNVLP
jgi:hypothetical protein